MILLKITSWWGILEGYWIAANIKLSGENYIRENVLSSTDNKLICVPAMSVLVDILEEKNDDARLECNKILDQLGNLDVIRKKYWEYRRNEVNNQKLK